MSYASFCSLFLLAFLVSFISYAQQQDPTYIYHTCPNATTYSKYSSYSTNLKSLLISLSSNSGSSSSGFYSTAAGQTPDVVFGLFLCRGDVSQEVCRECVVFAAKDTLNLCPNERTVTLYYDECMLRYSDGNILMDFSMNGGIILFNPLNFTSNQQDRFIDLVLSTMNQLATEASNSSRRFHARKANFSALQNLYGLAQCTPDLTSQECLECLQLSINQLPTDKIGGRLIVPSCSSRYELYLFYNETAIGRPQLQLDSAPPPVFENTGKGGNSSVIILAVVVPVTAVFLLFVAVFVFRAKRKKTVYEMEPLAEGGKLPFL
ncbi:unnamed protein product [Arabis nemorensis]|uniref:Gnk2-homologous domain-containing protein n=1 Tax=Arabis nemorensis TaxID=586526 RepID=A0A565C9J2_9BRAS|nr:unnamed protein product [Arabis nemorensis]